MLSTMMIQMFPLLIAGWALSHRATYFANVLGDLKSATASPLKRWAVSNFATVITEPLINELELGKHVFCQCVPCVTMLIAIATA